MSIGRRYRARSRRRGIQTACRKFELGDNLFPRHVEKAAVADPDAQPLTEADAKRMKRTPQTKIIRRALELTQEEFSSRYHIPLGMLRDWEQGRAEPDQPARAYLMVIARDPEHVNRTLNPQPH